MKYSALDSITPDHRDYAGLCAAVKRHLRSVYGWSWSESIREARNLQESLTTQWHEYSGDGAYPLPGKAVSYYKYDCDPHPTVVREVYMWDRATSPYAELRWQLIEYLRAQCAAIIEDRRIADKLHHVLLCVQDQRLDRDGICDNIRSILMAEGSSVKDRYDMRGLMDDLFKTWPEFSGSQSYPVCTVYQAYGGEPREQYITASNTFTMWEGEYGAARIRLLNFLIEQTRPE